MVFSHFPFQRGAFEQFSADLYIPRNTEGRLPAIAVSGPFGAVKEQPSVIYAQNMAERRDWLLWKIC